MYGESIPLTLYDLRDIGTLIHDVGIAFGDNELNFSDIVIFREENELGRLVWTEEGIVFKADIGA